MTNFTIDFRSFLSLSFYLPKVSTIGCFFQSKSKSPSHPSLNGLLSAKCLVFFGNFHRFCSQLPVVRVALVVNPSNIATQPTLREKTL